MASPVSSVAAISAAYQPVSSTPAKVAASASASGTPQDTVHLSKQALSAAGGDVDHDGDSR